MPRRLNSHIRWHILDNWGRFMRSSPRHGKRRKSLASLIRSIRKSRRILAKHFRACIWLDALVTD
jgi:hypothetical protein